MSAPQLTPDLIANFIAAFVGGAQGYGQSNASKPKPWTADGVASEDVWLDHLNGGNRVGHCPLHADGMCWFGFIDIDQHDEAGSDLPLVAFARRVAGLGLPLVVFRSKRGGIHLGLFLSAPMPARQVRAVLRAYAAAIIDLVPSKTGESPKVPEIFPKQDTLDTSKGIGNWIHTPYYGIAHGKTDTYAVDASGEPILDLATALDLIKSKRVAPEELTETVARGERIAAQQSDRAAVTTGKLTSAEEWYRLAKTRKLGDSERNPGFAKIFGKQARDARQNAAMTEDFFVDECVRFALAHSEPKWNAERAAELARDLWRADQRERPQPSAPTPRVELSPEYLAELIADAEANPFGGVALTDQPFYWAEDLLDNPDLLIAPTPTIPHLAWPGRLTLLYGQEKLGKSTVLTAAVAALSHGNMFLDQYVSQGRTLWVSADNESLQDIAQRIEKFGVSRGRWFAAVLGTKLGDSGGKGGPGVYATIRKLVADVRPDVLIIDTLYSLAFDCGLVASGADNNSSLVWAPIMSFFIELVRETGIAVILVHHSPRSDANRYIGAVEIGRKVDVLVNLRESDKGETRTLSGRGRVPVPTVSYRLNEAGDGIERAFSRDEAIQDYVRANPGVGVNRIVKAVGGKAEAVKARIAELEKAGTLVNEGKGQAKEYRLKESA